jgi:hypothetical protein
MECLTLLHSRALQKPLSRCLDAQKWICREVIVFNLQKAMPRVKEISRVPPDYDNLVFATTNELLIIAYRRADLLRRVD